MEFQMEYNEEKEQPVPQKTDDLTDQLGMMF